MAQISKETAFGASQAAFYAGYLGSVRSVRTALLNAFQALEIDPARPREAARRLGLDKSLVWKLTRVVNEEQLPEVASIMPGTSGIRMVCRAMREQDTPEPLIDAIESAYQQYLSMVEQYSGDRESLEMMLYGMGDGDDERFRKSRQAAYRGNAGIWGVQASARVVAHILKVSDDDPGLLNHAQFGGLVGFHRLRPGPSWPIFKYHAFEDSGAHLGTTMRTLSDASDPAFPLIIPEFCRGNMPEIQMTCDPQITSYEFGDGEIGRSGNCDVFFGYLDDDPKQRYRDERNQIGELLCIVDTPFKTLIFDLIVQRELAAQISPEVLIYGRATGPHLSHELRDERSLIPHTESLRMIEPGAHMLATPIVPSYDAIGTAVMDRLGWALEDFMCWRLVMVYPVMPSSVSVKFELPAKPG